MEDLVSFHIEHCVCPVFSRVPGGTCSSITSKGVTPALSFFKHLQLMFIPHLYVEAKCKRTVTTDRWKPKEKIWRCACDSYTKWSERRTAFTLFTLSFLIAYSSSNNMKMGDFLLGFQNWPVLMKLCPRITFHEILVNHNENPRLGCGMTTRTSLKCSWTLIEHDVYVNIKRWQLEMT